MSEKTLTVADQDADEAIERKPTAAPKVGLTAPMAGATLLVRILTKGLEQ